MSHSTIRRVSSDHRLVATPDARVHRVRTQQMPPTSDGESVRTVGCALAKLVRNLVHLQKIRDAVTTTHKATILASELLNLHIRRVLDSDATADLS